MRRIGLPEYAEALGSGIRVDSDTLPVPEQQMRGIALEEGCALWCVAGRDSDAASCRQLWPSLQQGRIRRSDRAVI
jgi:hypothetical protein